jgi:hypothetical protein
MVRSIRSEQPPYAFAEAIRLPRPRELPLFNSRDSLLPEYGVVMSQLGEDQPTTAGIWGDLSNQSRAAET